MRVGVEADHRDRIESRNPEVLSVRRSNLRTSYILGTTGTYRELELKVIEGPAGQAVLSGLFALLSPQLSLATISYILLRLRPARHMGRELGRAKCWLTKQQW
jgi:hypothetical protein